MIFTTGLDPTPPAAPTSAPASSGGFFSSLGTILGSAATGYGYGLATRATSSGRTPGLEQLATPQQTLPTAAQPSPSVGATLQNYMPAILIGGGILAAILVVSSLRK